MAEVRQRRFAAGELFEYAVRLLSRRAYASAELRSKLDNRALRPEDVDAILSRLRDVGYINDRRFAESFASARLENQGFGRLRVIRDLRARRIASSLASQAVQQVYGATEEPELIDDFIRRKFRGESLQENRDLAAAYRKLLRAGFSRSAIMEALKRHSSRTDVLDNIEPPDEEPEET
jgi:regulatory protein